MPWLIHSRGLFNPPAVLPMQQLATGVTGGYYWHVPTLCNGWEHSLLLPVLLPEEGPFPIADFQSLYAFTGVLHMEWGFLFPCLQCFSVPVNNWPFHALLQKTEHSGFWNGGKIAHHYVLQKFTLCMNFWPANTLNTNAKLFHAKMKGRGRRRERERERESSDLIEKPLINPSIHITRMI